MLLEYLGAVVPDELLVEQVEQHFRGGDGFPLAYEGVKSFP